VEAVEKTGSPSEVRFKDESQSTVKSVRRAPQTLMLTVFLQDFEAANRLSKKFASSCTNKAVKLRRSLRPSIKSSISRNAYLRIASSRPMPPIRASETPMNLNSLDFSARDEIRSCLNINTFSDASRG
jgi:hypothetical protein